LWVFAPDELVSEIDCLAKNTWKLHKRCHVIWYYTFGVASTKNFSRSHTHILYYTKRKNRFIFNADEIRVPSARQLVYNDKRQNVKGKLPDNTWVLTRAQLEECFGADNDTWLESRVCGTFRERRDHSPNQLPEALIERIIKACSNPGDLVVDPFLGTGTTIKKAVELGRRGLGIDVSAVCVEESRKRILAALPKDGL
jgi:site-specific DNA-methyltransferase (adenine-specific)